MINKNNKKLKVLVACEYSGRTREAFRALGHDVISADFELSEDDSPYHYQGDCFDLINDQHFDLMIAHPPCTYLSVSGMHWTTRGLRDPKLTEDALDFVQALMNAPIEKICIENPVSVISSRIRKPDQIIQPWKFGEDASKKTCLWLKNLPELEDTKIIPPKEYKQVAFASDMLDCELCGELFRPECNTHYSECEHPGPMQDELFYKTIEKVLFASEIEGIKPVWSNQTKSGQNNLPPGPNRWKERSRTYQGISDAMAEQWGCL